MTERFTTKKDLTVRELYEMLEPLVDELGDCEVLVRYDGGTTLTPIRKQLPFRKIRMYGNGADEDTVIIFEGY